MKYLNETQKEHIQEHFVALGLHVNNAVWVIGADTVEYEEVKKHYDYARQTMETLRVMLTAVENANEPTIQENKVEEEGNTARE